MNEVEFTKGDLTVDDYFVYDRDDNLIGDLVGRGTSIEEGKANALLFSKANKMYEQLSSVVSELESLINEVNMARMSKVTQQTETPPDLWDMETLHNISVLLAQVRGDI